MQVVCAAITEFFVVFVENLVVPVIFRKMLPDKDEKLSTDFCLYVHAIGRIKQNYVPVLCGLGYRFVALSLDKSFVVSTLFKCTFIVWFGFVKEFFA